MQHEVKETVNINAYTFLNNGLIFNLLVLLELSQFPLCISCIGFDMFDLIYSITNYSEMLLGLTCLA